MSSLTGSVQSWNSDDQAAKESTSKFIDWVGSILLTKKLTEDIVYQISVKTTALFVNVAWNNHLQNPTSEQFNVTTKVILYTIFMAALSLVRPIIRVATSGAVEA